MTQEQLDQLNTKAAVKQSMKESKGGKEDKFRDELLDFQTFKKYIKQALLGVDIVEKTIPAEEMPEDVNYPITVDFVKIPEKGIRKPRFALSDNEKELAYQDALCNEKCVNDIITELHGAVNPNLGASKFGRQDVMAVGRPNELAIIDMLAQNFDKEEAEENPEMFNPKYEIVSEADADLIVAIIRSNLKGILGKAKNANFLKQITENREFRYVGKEEGGEDDGGLTSLLP